MRKKEENLTLEFYKNWVETQSNDIFTLELGEEEFENIKKNSPSNEYIEKMEEMGYEVLSLADTLLYEYSVSKDPIERGKELEMVKSIKSGKQSQWDNDEDEF